jgi:nitrate/TMAO reductase-like tetraheme cytochrome c subunit
MTRLLVTFIAVAFLGAFANLACGAEPNVHDTQEATSNPCIHCHTSAYQAALNPKHDGVFEESCDDCHKTKKAWAPIPEFHELDAIAEKECVGCHQKEFDATTQPDHKTRNFGTDCKDCHGTDKYRPLRTNVHTTQTFTKKQCFDCHASNYDKTLAPNHKQAGFPTTCNTCHVPVSWVPSVPGGTGAK